MFVKAIEKNREWTYPLVIGKKGQKDIETIIGTMIKINNDGCFLTAKHIATPLIESLNTSTDNVIFPFNIRNNTKIDIIVHKYLDIAVIKINDMFLEGECPKFSNEVPSPGMSICKLGYAFNNPEPFTYDKKAKKVIINSKEAFEMPIFPYDGMITRTINFNIDNVIIKNAAFETSTAGLRGQSGGPIFDKDGLIYGIQTMNMTMPLNYSYINEENIHEQFINFGVGISSVKIIEFFKENKINYE